MLGKPKEGVHSIRYLNIAVVDVLLTILLAKFIQLANFSKNSLLIIKIMLM